MLASRGAGAVRRELLVGFDPVPTFLALLERRFGELAVFCADYTGGTVAAIKWRPAAFLQAPLRPALAHALCALTPAAAPEAPAGEEEEAGGGSQRRKGKRQSSGAAKAPSAPRSAAATVPDVAGILADVLHLGAGLVDSLEVL